MLTTSVFVCETVPCGCHVGDCEINWIPNTFRCPPTNFSGLNAMGRRQLLTEDDHQ
eukprot:gnl/Chilomastix_caulleri/1793.p3 GENE.gnl/Chilomastix_caulleri/1793~~gnl/Chilomastix_caulleri/1793.p3  ORF type:complete len:56 (+),score=10.05 gnl/Chilomastix_caulleri/1793:123-290(+)